MGLARSMIWDMLAGGSTGLNAARSVEVGGCSLARITCDGGRKGGREGVTLGIFGLGGQF